MALVGRFALPCPFTCSTAEEISRSEVLATPLVISADILKASKAVRRALARAGRYRVRRIVLSDARPLVLLILLALPGEWIWRRTGTAAATGNEAQA